MQINNNSQSPNIVLSSLALFTVYWSLLPISLLQLCHSAMSNSLRPHGLQHTRPPCPSPIPGAAQIHAHQVCNAIQPSHPLLSPCPPAFCLSRIRVVSNESVLHIRWPKYRSFSLSISPSNENTGLISFRMDWLDLLGVQQTLKSLLQHHSSKTSVFWHSAFFIVQCSHPYMTIGKTIALTISIFFNKVIASYSLYNCKQLVLLMNWHESWKTGDSLFSDLLAKMLISQRHWLIKCVIFHWLLTNVCLLLLVTSRSKGKEIIGKDSASLVLLIQMPFLGRMF